MGNAYTVARKLFKVPNKVRITHKITYEVAYVPCFDDPAQYGSCDYDKKLILIKAKLSPRKTLEALLHEIAHALEFEHKIKIPHEVIHKLEKPVSRMLKLNGWI